MSSKACDQCGKHFTSVHRTTCYACKPTTGPSKAQMLAMAGLEDDGGSCSVGGMAVDLGIYPTVEQFNDLTAANARVEELTKLVKWYELKIIADQCGTDSLLAKAFDDNARLRELLREWVSRAKDRKAAPFSDDLLEKSEEALQ